MTQIRSQKDFWAGVVFLAIAAGFIALASRYNYGSMHRMGPAMFPTLVSILLAALGGVLLVRSFVLNGPKLDRLAFRPLVVTVLAIALFGLTLRTFGLVAAVALLVVVGSYASRVERLAPVLVSAVVLIAFSVIVFVRLLGLPLPVWPSD